MKKSGKVIPLFENEKDREHVERGEAGFKPVSRLALERPEENLELKEAGVGDWIMENCNELPVHESENGLVFVGVPLHTFDELLRLVVDSVNDYETMRSALERIAERENELDRKIARTALSALSN